MGLFAKKQQLDTDAIIKEYGLPQPPERFCSVCGGKTKFFITSVDHIEFDDISGKSRDHITGNFKCQSCGHSSWHYGIASWKKDSWAQML